VTVYQNTHPASTKFFSTHNLNRDRHTSAGRGKSQFEGVRTLQVLIVEVLFWKKGRASEGDASTDVQKSRNPILMTSSPLA